jgi:predicted permease
MLLRLYPRAYRGRWGQELEATMRACIARERRRLGARGVLYAWIRLGLDALYTGTQLRLQTRRPHQVVRAPLLQDVLRDTRYAFRALRRAPAFTLLSTITLALGIGTVSAVFSVVNGVIIKPLPYPDSANLVSIWNTSRDPESPGLAPLSATQFFTYRDENETFAALGVWSMRTATVMLSTAPEEVNTLHVTEGALEAIGVRPAIGRSFSREDDTPGSPESVILMDGFWKRRYGADPSVIGRTLIVDARPLTVIGVMPAGFRFLNEEPQVILAFRFERSRLVLGAFNYFGIGRLKGGISQEHADADLSRMNAIWLNAWPSPPGFQTQTFAKTPALRPLKHEVVGDVRGVLWVLMGTTGLVLLIACANVANLQLVRAHRRRHAMAVRAALGAGSFRIAREFLLEGLLLGLMGGALGLALAAAAIHLLVSLAPAGLPRLHEIGINGVVLAFSMVISLVSGVGFGLFLLLGNTSLRLEASLRSHERTSSETRQQRRTRDALVVAQMALAVVLLIGSGLMIRTFLALRSVEPGFAHPAHIQMVRMSIPESLVNDPERIFRMQTDIRERIARIPGVSLASLSSAGPMERYVSANQVFAEGQAGNEGKTRRFKFILPAYFQVIGTPMLAGRDFEWADFQQRRPVAIVSDNTARELWHTPAAAVGRRIRENPEGPWREIVGVVRDVTEDGLHLPAPTIVYWPALVENFEGERIRIKRSTTLVIRSARAGSEELLKDIQRTVGEVNANIPIARAQTLNTLYEASLATTTFTLVVLVSAGAIALVLGLVGVHGVIACAVAQRTREIGIRVALGAAPGEVKRMFILQGVVLAGIGTFGGLVAAGLLSRFLSSQLFGISSLDPVTYAAVSAILAATATSASYIPARRATAVDPVTALRAQ